MRFLILIALVGVAAYLIMRFMKTSSGVAAAGTARIQRLEDIEVIRRLLNDYGRHLDRRDFRAYSELFAWQGVWDGGFGSATGPAEIQAMMERTIGGVLNEGPQANFHVLTNADIQVNGDEGTAWSRWTFVAQNPDKSARVLYAGRYDDQLIREDGRWKFKRRLVSGDLPGQAPPQGPPS